MEAVAFSHRHSRSSQGCIFLHDIRSQICASIFRLLHSALQIACRCHVPAVEFFPVDQGGELLVGEEFLEGEAVLPEEVGEDLDVGEAFQFGLVFD